MCGSSPRRTAILPPRSVPNIPRRPVQPHLGFPISSAASRARQRRGDYSGAVSLPAPRTAALGASGFSADAVETLLERRWPGNVRELKNAWNARRFSPRRVDHGPELAQLDWSRAAEGLPESGPARSDTPRRGTAGTTGRGPQVGDGTPSVRLTAGGDAARAGTLAEFERGYIAEVLESCGGKIYGPDGAAAALGSNPPRSRAGSGNSG